MRLFELYQDPTKFGFSKLAHWDMRKAWQLECDCLVPLAEAEQAGLPICLPTLKHLEQLVIDGMATTLVTWQALNTGISRPTQIKKIIPYLNTKYGLNLKKGDKGALSEYKEYPEVSLRFTYSGLSQYLSKIKKLGKGALDTGRAKTNYSVLSGTGRTSSGGQFSDIVNIQSIPSKVDSYLDALKLPSIRSAFKPCKGKAFIVSDLAASHARIACDFAKDTLGMAVQNNDVDAHSLFAILISQCIPDLVRARGLPEKFLENAVTIQDVDLLNAFKSGGKIHQICKQLRDLSKNIYYGKLNGASWKRIQTEIKAQLKIQVSDDEARAISAVFEELYPDLTNYCKSVAAKLESKENQMWLDGKLFGISSIADTQQRLLFDLKYDDNGINVPYTNCIAAQWSRTEATAIKKALIICHKLFRKHEEWGAKVINIVHDELNIECDEAYAVPVARVVAWAMSRCFQAELKNGVAHGGANFRNQHSEKYLLNDDGSQKIDSRGKPIYDPRFDTSVCSLIVNSWADK